jgi:hypothetical protein
MNFSTKSLDHKFYGKTIRTFTELEGELFELDLLMSMTFMVTKMDGQQNNKVEETLIELGKSRFLICSELLGYTEEMIEIISIENVLCRIEESDYGYGKFLIDHEENSKLIPKEDMDIIQKLLRNELSKKENVIKQITNDFRRQPSYMMN